MMRRRSWLFVPGDRPERFDKAVATGADAVVCDLEDAVLPAHKAGALEHVRGWTRDHQAFVRINAVGTPWYETDLAALRDSSGVLGVLLPKAESAEAVSSLRSALDDRIGLVLLIESALGLSRVTELAGAPGVSRLGFGSVDYSEDLGIAHTELALLHARSALVVASRVAGLDQPLDGVTADFADRERCRAEAARSRELGFGGKLCIHPSQVADIDAAFVPTEAEIAWARRVVEEAANAAHGAVSADGELIDVPVLRRAERILAEPPAVQLR